MHVEFPKRFSAFAGLCLVLSLGRTSLADEPVSFVNDIQPILTKLGCNQGACHGAQYGQGGFKLSLRAFDDAVDHVELVRGAFGRRIKNSAVEESLLLTKPLMDVPHGGGRRLKKESWAFETLVKWIKQGAPGPQANDRKLKQVVVTPTESILRGPISPKSVAPAEDPTSPKSGYGQQAQLTAKAVYEDGFEESIERKASFDSMNASVVEVTPEGQVIATGKGETVVMVRYLGTVTVSRIVVPFGQSVGLENFAKHNYVDELWVEKWRKTGLSPTKLCTDEEFFRRIHFSTIATLPAIDDLKAFLADTDPDKRNKAIDRVLQRPEYMDFWAYKWGDLLRNNRNSLQKKGMWSLHNWLRASFRDNKPMVQFATELITAVGSPYQNGPVNFFVNGYQEEWTEATAATFLGVRVQCAKCHHHPYENISQADYHSLRAFFARVGKKSSWEFGIQGGEFVIYVNDTGEVGHPRTGAILPPKPLGAAPADDPVDRRRALAAWLVDKSNPAYARNLVNRYWGYYFGRGLVSPIDDMRVTNPAANAELLDALAKDLIAHNYDVKHLLRTIMRSHVYQLSSTHTGYQVGGTALAAGAVTNETPAASAVPLTNPDGDNRYVTHFSPTRLKAEQLLDAVDFACGTQEKFPEVPLGFRAISLPDSNFPNEFLDAFGRPRRVITCECERSDTPSMTQALLMISGGLLNRKVTDGSGRIAKLVKASTPADQVVTELFLCTLSRSPTAEEKQAALAEIATASSPQEGYEDFLWTLLNTREFQFNH